MTFPTLDKNVTYNVSHGFMYANTPGHNYLTQMPALYMQETYPPVVSNRLYSPHNIANMKSHLEQMKIRVAEHMERQKEGQILETQIIQFEKAFAPILGNASFFGPVQAAAEEHAPILGNASFVGPVQAAAKEHAPILGDASFVGPVQAAAEDPDSRSTVGKIFSSAVGPEKHDSRSTYSQILSNVDNRPDEQTDRQIALQLQQKIDEDLQSEDLQKQAKDAEEDEQSETKVPRFLNWCNVSTNITELVKKYESKPLNNFREKQLKLLQKMQQVFDRTGSYDAAVTYGVRDGWSTYEENKKIWKLAHQLSIGEIVEKAYREAQKCETDEKYFKSIKRCWYKTNIGDGGSFAKDRAEQLSRFDHMVYLNWKKIAVNDCMGLGKFSYDWWTNFKVAGA